MNPDLKEQVLARLRGEQMIALIRSFGLDVQQSGSEYKTLCPFHDDHHPSLHINVTKHDGGIFKCFSCGWGGDVFKFAGDFHNIIDFKDQLHFLAERVGIPTDRVIKPGHHPRTNPRPVEKAPPKIEVMTAGEVVAVYDEAKLHAEDPAPWAEKLSGPLADFYVQAMEMIGAVVVQRYDDMVLVVPMRQPDGRFTSLRFRSFETGRRWSLDVKAVVDGKRVQVKTSHSGLMTYDDFLDPDICLNGSITVFIEGETDLLAALAMMLRDCGNEPCLWPARWCALPGVGSCHDMLFECLLSKVIMLLFDDDDAGRSAIFFRRPTKMVEEDGKRRQVPNLDVARQPGLLHRFQHRGYAAAALFPPKSEDKYDLRDWVGDGLSWPAFHSYALEHATRDPQGLVRRARPNVASPLVEGIGDDA